MNQKFLTCLVLMTALILMGCSSNIPNGSGMDNQIVFQLNSNDSIAVKYDFTSSVNPVSINYFEKEYEGQFIPSKTGLVLNHSAALNKMVAEFMRYRFTTLENKATSVINYELKSFSLTSEDTEPGLLNLLNGILGVPPTRLYTSEIQMTININHNDQSYTRDLYGRANLTGIAFHNSKQEAIIFDEIINGANNRLIYFADQFLSEIGL